MCTLGGFFSIEPSEISLSTLSNIVSQISVRGRDAYGIIIRNENDEISREVSFFESSLKLDETAQSVSIVARAVPAAERVERMELDERDVQPFFNDQFIVSHNGLIANDKKLRDLYAIQTESSIDTSILPSLFSKVGIVKGIMQLQASFALAIVDRVNNIFYLATNFMPLYYKVDNKVVYYHSLPQEDTTKIPLNYNGWKQVPYYSILKFSNQGIEKIDLPNLLNNQKVLVICSGGLDSVTTARLYQVLGYDVSILFFKYGQQAEKAEDWATTKFSEEFDLRKYTVNVKDIFKQCSTPSLLLGNSDIELDRHLDMESTLSYVGARNFIMSSIAFSLAEKLGIGKIALGLNIDDGVYPDNNITFAKDLERLSNTVLDWNKRLEVRAPFVNMTKKEIIDVAIAIGSPFDKQISCYYPIYDESTDSYYNCGACGCDKLREYSFKAAEYKDPVKYDNNISFEGYKELPEYYYENRKRKLMEKEEIPYFKYLYL